MFLQLTPTVPPVVERASESNILLAADYLSRNPVGDQGEATNAPPAAGGAL
jgi:hypothetical protein